MLKHLKTSLLLASSLLLSLPQTQAQLGKNLKEKAQNLKPGKKEEKSSDKGGNKWDKRQFQGNPISDAVLNEDFKHNDEQKDATGISGYYYAYFPLTGKIEKVWVRYNNYKYDKEMYGVKFNDSKQAVVTVYTKELNDFEANKYVSSFQLEPWNRVQWEKEGYVVNRNGAPFIHTPVVFKKDVFAVNVPVKITVSDDRIAQYTFSWHLDTLAQYQKKTAQRYSDWERMEKILANEPRAQFAIIAKNRKDLEAYNDYEKFKKAVEETTKKSVEQETNYLIAVIEKPKAIKEGEFFSNKAWYEAAKEGLLRNQVLAPGEKVLFGFVPQDLNWQTFNNRATGEPTHQQAFYYLVCQRNPERNNRRSEYFIIAAFIKRNHSGGGKYDQPVYNSHSGSVDISPSEMEAYKPFKLN